jgi:hypothetical protein
VNEILRWPADRFYWALVECDGWREAGPLPPGLMQQFADSCPEDPGGLHAVCLPCGPARLLVGAARRDDLASVHALSLTPESLPPFIETDADPASMEFLVGRFEPEAVGRGRARRHALLQLTTVAAAVLLSIGLLRRAGAANDTASAARERAATVIAAALPADRPTTLETLSRELDRRRAVSRLQAEGATARASDALEALLAAWPETPAASPRSIHAEPGVVTASVRVKSSPESFVDALNPPPGWSLLGPQITRVGPVSHVELKLSRPGVAR